MKLLGTYRVWAILGVLVAVLFLLSASLSTALAGSGDNIQAKFNPKTDPTTER